MFRVLALTMTILVSGLAVNAQQPQSTPPPPTSTPLPQATPFPQTVRPVGIRASDSPFGRGSISESNRIEARIVMLHTLVEPLYRKPTNKEMDVMMPSSKVLGQYATFLDTPNTGIFRLVPDVGCAASDKVINASEECLKYSMPGGGNSFSFRAKRYRIKHLADITLIDDKLKITGTFMHGMMADVGDVPIDSVSLSSPGMKFLTDFQPSTNSDGVINIDNKLLNGVEQDGYRYSKEAAAIENSTYVFRSVAYRGKVLRSVRGFAYNELNYDKREDVIVVFRVVERLDDGSVTIVWKQLTDQQSPKIKMPKVKSQDDS